MSIEYYQTLIDRGGGMISCGDNLGVFIGIAELACPPGWIFINAEDATVEGISEAVEHLKKGRKTGPERRIAIMHKQCVIYSRFSPRPNADECDSCEKQEERCSAYAHKKNYLICGHFRDRNVSGGKLFRSGLQAAINFLKPGWVLLIDRTDRLARDMLVGYAIRKQVEEVGATIEYADGTPSGSSPEEKFLQGIMLLVASFERDRIVSRTQAGMDRKKKACERVGTIPVGWKLDPDDPEKKKLVQDCNEWRAIQKMCEWSADGSSIVEIHKLLHLGFGQCRGGSWSPKTIRRLIKKHRYWACPKTGDRNLQPSHPI